MKLTDHWSSGIYNRNPIQMCILMVEGVEVYMSVPEADDRNMDLGCRTRSN